jgi:hypothetical protein
MIWLLRFLLALAIGVGVGAAVATVILKNPLHLEQIVNIALIVAISVQ